MRRHGTAAVEREGQEVADAVGQDVPVTRKRRNLNAVALVFGKLPHGILAQHLHVRVEQLLILHLHGSELIGRVRGVAVDRTVGKHHADRELRPVVVCGDDSLCRSQELVERRVGDVLRVGVDEAGGHERRPLDAVDLVEGEVVLHEAVEAREARGGVLHEDVHQIAAIPAIEAVGQRERVLIVLKGNKWLDAVLAARLEDILIEGETGLVWLLVVAVGEDAAPLDGEAQALEALLGAEADVLLVVVIEVTRDVRGIVDVGIVDRASHRTFGQVLHRAAKAQGKLVPAAIGHAEGDLTRDPVSSVGHDVSGGEASATLEDATLVLVGCRGATPKEVLVKTHVCLLSLSSHELFYAWLFSARLCAMRSRYQK